MSAARDRLQFAQVMGAEGVPFDLIEQVLRDGATLHRLAETACTRELTERESARELFLEERMSGRLAAYGIVAQFQGDPRGAVVKLRLPSGRANDFGGEGYWCVP